MISTANYPARKFGVRSAMPGMLPCIGCCIRCCCGGCTGCCTCAPVTQAAWTVQLASNSTPFNIFCSSVQSVDCHVTAHHLFLTPAASVCVCARAGFIGKVLCPQLVFVPPHFDK